MDLTDMVKPSLLQRQKRRDKRMHEEVIEVGRGNGGKKNKKNREVGYKAFYQKNFPDAYPVNISITPRGSMTFFDDNLGLLKKFLMTHVGQKWDEVFAQLNAKLDSRSLQGMHIIGHIFDFVELNVHMEDGKVVRKIPLRFIWRSECRRQHSFYVHPESGILSRWCTPKKEACPKKARFKKEKEKRKWKMRAEQKTDKTPPKVFEDSKNTEGEQNLEKTGYLIADKQKRSEKWFNKNRVGLKIIQNQKPKTSEERFRLLF